MRKNLLVSSLLVCVAMLLGSQAAFASDNWSPRKEPTRRARP